jgi:hypothetical protein
MAGMLGRMEESRGTATIGTLTGRLDRAWRRRDDSRPRYVPPGGEAAKRADGRPVLIPAAPCRAMTADRAGSGQCRRKGWFALRQIDGDVVQPLCATHLQRLIAAGGPVLG